MPLKVLASKAVAQIEEIVKEPLSDDQRSDVSRVVEQAIIDAVLSTSSRFTEIARTRSGPKTDIAHQIAEELKSAETVLIANLMGMR